jgi:hypothetical protein
MASRIIRSLTLERKIFEISGNIRGRWWIYFNDELNSPGLEIGEQRCAPFGELCSCTPVLRKV